MKKSSVVLHIVLFFCLSVCLISIETEADGYPDYFPLSTTLQSTFSYTYDKGALDGFGTAVSPIDMWEFIDNDLASAVRSSAGVTILGTAARDRSASVVFRSTLIPQGDIQAELEFDWKDLPHKSYFIIRLESVLEEQTRPESLLVLFSPDEDKLIVSTMSPASGEYKNTQSVKAKKMRGKLTLVYHEHLRTGAAIFNGVSLGQHPIIFTRPFRIVCEIFCPQNSGALEFYLEQFHTNRKWETLPTLKKHSMLATRWINNAQGFKKGIVDGVDGEWFSKTVEETFTDVNVLGISFMDENDTEAIREYHPPLRFMRFPAQTWDAWTGDCLSVVNGKEDYAISYSVQVLDDTATVETPLGVFSNCLLYQNSYTIDGNTSLYKYWFAPGIGLVRQEQAGTLTSKQVITLVDTNHILPLPAPNLYFNSFFLCKDQIINVHLDSDAQLFLSRMQVFIWFEYDSQSVFWNGESDFSTNPTPVTLENIKAGVSRLIDIPLKPLLVDTPTELTWYAVFLDPSNSNHFSAVSQFTLFPCDH